jgi:hypothetical protein
MSVQASSSRPASKSIGAAFVDLLLTLVIFIVVLLAFLIAPLLALALAYLCYVVWRPRTKGARPGLNAVAPSGESAQRAAGSAHGFGAGTT